MQKLPIPSPKERKEKPWFIKNWSNDERARMTADALHMTCVPGSVGMSSGSGFHATPLQKFPTDHIVFEYEVYFPSDVNFVKGGKLPGIGIGVGDDTATGSEWSNDAGSVRFMWREQGQAIAYVYLPLHIAPNKKRDGTITVQSKDFETAAEGALGKHAGIDLFFKKKTGLQFKKGHWNTVRLEVKLNDVTQANGLLSVTINGVTRTIDNVIFRKKPNVQINMILAQAFFGGSTLDWQAKKKETISFRNFAIAFP